MQIPHSWLDRMQMLIGIWLCMSPWVLDLPDIADWCMVAVGIYVFVFALEDSFLPNRAEEVGNVLLGLGLMASPWLFSYDEYAWAMKNALIAGGLVAVLALWELFDSAAMIKQKKSDQEFDQI